MSALQDILDKMYVDPELLKHLGEEQKLLLFIKMREEQVRRWKLNEEKLEQEEKSKENRLQKKEGKRVRWLTGKDGNVWVWLMGEHPDDLPIEEILANEAKKKARKLAEKEILLESLNINNLNTANLNKDFFANQLCNMNLKEIFLNNQNLEENKKNVYYNSIPNSNTKLDYKLENGFSMNKLKHSLPQNLQILENNVNDDQFDNYSYRLPSQTLNNLKSITNKNTNNNYILPNLNDNELIEQNHTLKNHLNPNKDFVQFTRSYVPKNTSRLDNNFTLESLNSNYLNNNVISPIASTTVFSSIPITSNPSFNLLELSSKLDYNISSGHVSRIAARLSNNESTKNYSTLNLSPDKLIHNVEREFNKSNMLKYDEDTKSKIVPENSVELLNDKEKIKTDTLLSKNSSVSLKSTLSDQLPTLSYSCDEQLRLGQQKNMRVQTEIDLKNQKFNFVDDEIEKRQSKILEKIIEKRNKINKEAEVEDQQQRFAWEEQKKKAKEAETQIRLIAQKARKEHLKSLRTSASLLPVLNDTTKISLKEAIKNLPRPPKPTSKNAIVQWYKKVELPNGTGFDFDINQPALWFHGIISRIDAEELLAEKTSGSYLVRVSERIWGYTISYVVKSGITKHFLVEKVSEGYQFLGTNQIVHHSLSELINYHKTSPITLKGQEFLLYPVGQQFNDTPDYAELLK